jgi:uncharacterized membrane protein YGL010W
MNLQPYFDQYEKAHLHRGNRLCHGIGIPMIIISLGVLVFSTHAQVGWYLFGIGWAFQFVGHALERTWPEFMKNPVYLLIGPLYFAHKLRSRFASGPR